MLVAFDIDGTVDAAPDLYLSWMQALRAAGHRVAILTGCSDTVVTQESVADKQTYLQNLGLAEAYDTLVVFADPPHEAKAEWLKDNNCNMFVDNSKKNAKLSPCLVLVPWQTRVD